MLLILYSEYYVARLLCVCVCARVVLLCSSIADLWNASVYLLLFCAKLRHYFRVKNFGRRSWYHLYLFRFIFGNSSKFRRSDQLFLLRTEGFSFIPNWTLFLWNCFHCYSTILFNFLILFVLLLNGKKIRKRLLLNTPSSIPHTVERFAFTFSSTFILICILWFQYHRAY